MLLDRVLLPMEIVLHVIAYCTIKIQHLDPAFWNFFFKTWCVRYKSNIIIIITFLIFIIMDSLYIFLLLFLLGDLLELFVVTQSPWRCGHLVMSDKWCVGMFQYGIYWRLIPGASTFFYISPPPPIAAADEGRKKMLMLCSINFFDTLHC